MMNRWESTHHTVLTYYCVEVSDVQYTVSRQFIMDPEAGLQNACGTKTAFPSIFVHDLMPLFPWAKKDMRRPLNKQIVVPTLQFEQKYALHFSNQQ